MGQRRMEEEGGIQLGNLSLKQSKLKEGLFPGHLEAKTAS